MYGKKPSQGISGFIELYFSFLVSVDIVYHTQCDNQKDDRSLLENTVMSGLGLGLSLKAIFCLLVLLLSSGNAKVLANFLLTKTTLSVVINLKINVTWCKH